MNYQLREVAEAAKSFIDVPFIHQGRGREEGMDCIGLVIAAYEAVGWTPLSPNTTYVDNYRMIPEGAMIEDYMALEADLVERKDAGPGDVVLMRFAKEPQHLGVLADGPPGTEGLYMVHSVNGAMGAEGVVMCSYDIKHQQRTKSIWRLRGGI